MKDDVKKITEQLEKGVKEIFTSDRFTEYLRFMSSFTDYSFNNCLLIMLQKPEATLCAGYKAWQQKGRQVRKGEKGIRILAPCPHKKEVEKDGEIKTIVWNTFRAVSIFDISQTDGDELPACPAQMLTGEVADFEELKQKLEGISPVPVSYEAIKGGANGFYSHTEKRIAVQTDMSEAQTLKTLIHEISHAILHDSDTGTETDADRSTREVQAESVAYTVCSMLGLDTSDYSFGYIAGWSTGKEVKELTESMETIRTTAKDIADKLAA
jgi:antirestriction protein ArdC